MLPIRPLYYHLYENTKNQGYLTASQMNQLHLPLPFCFTDEKQYKLYQVNVPFSYFFQYTGNPS